MKPGSDKYEEAQAGALDFTMKLGTSFNVKTIIFNGLYDGAGGVFGGKRVPALACDNVWTYK